MKPERPPIAPMPPIAMIGIRHVPPAAVQNRIFHFGIASEGAYADVFVAARESVAGTSATSTDVRSTAAFGGKADIEQTSSNDRVWTPKRTLNRRSILRGIPSMWLAFTLLGQHISERLRDCARRLYEQICGRA